MKTLLLALSLLNFTACSTAGFAHGFKCSYVDCNNSRSHELDLSPEGRSAYGEQHFADTPEGKATLAAEERNPELKKKMDAAVLDDTVIITKKRGRNGGTYYEAR